MEPIRSLWRTARSLDMAAWRAIGVTIFLFGGLGLVFVSGAALTGIDGLHSVEQSLGAASRLGLWALPVTVVAFAFFAVLGVPQFALVAAAVVAFGPWLGFAYSFVGNLVASTIGFYIGRLVGAETVRKYAGPTLNRLMTKVSKNGFLTSLLIRLVPTAPFMIVNMALGVAGIKARDFILGTAIGSIPKIALTVFAGHAVIKALENGGAGHIAMLIGTLAAWIAMAWIVRRWLKPELEEQIDEAAADAAKIDPKAIPPAR